MIYPIIFAELWLEHRTSKHRVRSGGIWPRVLDARPVYFGDLGGHHWISL